ncbi:HU family DNA-binding protein [bacterium]|nr:HU family DNA-binding protein [bacterium]
MKQNTGAKAEAKVKSLKKSNASKKQKINKNEFLDMIAKTNNMSVGHVRDVYDAIVDGVKNVVCKGQDLSLTGFGTFTLKKHKGHPVQFEAKSDKVNDYVVLKFAASDVLMSRIRADYDEGTAISSEDFNSKKGRTGQRGKKTKNK